MRSKDQFLIRSPKDTDLNFILASFSASMKKESSLGKSCSPSVFYPAFLKIIDYLLQNSSVLVAADNDTDIILGYIVYEPSNIVHYVYVKSPYRRLNIAKDLVQYAMPEAKEITFTLATRSSREIRKKYPELNHNPFILFSKGIK